MGWQAVATSSKTKSQFFSASGSFTVPAGVSCVFVSVWGAGGSGIIGSPGGGGGSGAAIVSRPVNVTPAQVVTVTIGAGGSTSNGSGAQGGSSSFGSLTANGGSGASGSTGGAGAGPQGASAGGNSTSVSSEFLSGAGGGTSAGSGGSMNGFSGGPGSTCGGGAAGFNGAGPSGAFAGAISAAANSGAGGGGGQSGTSTGGSGGCLVVWGGIMAVYAVVDNGVVSNIIVADAAFAAMIAPQHDAVVLQSNSCTIGYTYANGVFTPPQP